MEYMFSLSESKTSAHISYFHRNMLRKIIIWHLHLFRCRTKQNYVKCVIITICYSHRHRDCQIYVSFSEMAVSKWRASICHRKTFFSIWPLFFRARSLQVYEGPCDGPRAELGDEILKTSQRLFIMLFETIVSL